MKIAKINRQIDAIAKEFFALSPKEQDALIKKHENGEWAKMLVASGAIKLIMEEMKYVKNKQKKQQKIHSGLSYD